MTHNEFKKEIKGMLAKHVNFCINSCEAFESGTLSTENVKNDLEVMKFQNLKGEIILQVLQMIPSNDLTMSADELWSILEQVESKKKIAKKNRSRIDIFYSEMESCIENK